MPGAIAVIMLAVAAFTTLVICRRRPSARSDWAIDVEQIKGFVYVGAAALLLLVAAVLVLGLTGVGRGRVESLAVLGFFGYALYLVASVGVLAVMAHRERRQGTPGPTPAQAQRVK